MAAGSISQRPNGRWTIRWRLKDGTHRRKTFTTKRDAERFLRQAVVDVERGVFSGAKRGETIGTLLADWWMSVDGKPRTIERYAEHRRRLDALIGDVPLGQIDYEFAQRLVQLIRSNPGGAKPYAPRTVHGVYGVFALAVKHGVNQGKIAPFNKPTLPSIQDSDLTIPSRADIERLAIAVDPRMMAMVIVAGYCGLREGELLALERANIRLDEQRMWIAKAINKTTGKAEQPKTRGSRRWVVLPTRAHEVLSQHLELSEGERVFGEMTARAIQKSWESGRRSLGLERVRFHDLRHAAASMMIASGWNIMQVSRQLGHSKPSLTLDVYGFLYPESFDDALVKLDAYLAST